MQVRKLTERKTAFPKLQQQNKQQQQKKRKKEKKEEKKREEEQRTNQQITHKVSKTIWKNKNVLNSSVEDSNWF